MRTILFFIPLFFIFSCKKYEGLEVESPGSEYAIPVGSAELGWNDVIANISDASIIQIDPDGLVHLNYKGVIQSFKGSDVAEFVDQFTAPLVFIDTFVVLPFSAPQGIDIDYAILSDGGARFGYRSDFEEPISVKITIDNILTPAGEPYIHQTFHQDWPVDSLTDSISFKGYTIRPTNDSIYVRYELFKESSMEFDKAEFIGATIFDFKVQYMEGFLGQEAFNIDRDTINLDFFEETINGDLFIEDPKVNIVINNSFGFPIRSSGSIFNFFKKDGGILELESSALDAINVDYPTLNEVGVKKITTFPFDNDNSNLSDLILSRPIALEYEFKANANPDLDTSIKGFLLDTSVFEIQVGVDLPLKGWVENFVADDSLDLNIDPIEEVESAELKLIIENQLPLVVEVQGLFLDDTNVPIDSIFTQARPVLSVEPNENATTETIYLPISSEKLNNIFDAQKMILSAEFNTSGDTNEVVEMLSSQKVNIKIGLKVKLKDE